MKILIIANFTSLPWEGSNSRFNYIINKITTKKNKVELITSNFQHEKKLHRNVEKSKLNNLKYKITMLEEPGYSKNVSLKRFYSHYILSQNLKKYLRKISKPDVIYCSIPSIDFAYEAAKYARKNNIKFIIDIQDLWPEAFKMVLKLPIINDIVFLPTTIKANYVYKTANDIIAVSETYVNRAVKVNKKYDKKASVYLGTDLNYFDKYKLRKRTTKKVILVYIGTLGHSYNIIDVIKAINLLNNKGYNNLEFKILGDGPLLTNLKDSAKKLNVNAIFLGRLPYEEMIKELSCCDIAINPIMKGAAQSIINKVGDYAAAGLPVISTQECLEYRNLVNEKQIGLNCDNDPKDIAEKIELLINNKELRKKMGLNNRKLAEEKFDRNKTYKEISDTITS